MTKRILMIEDTEDNRQIVRDLIDSVGYELQATQIAVADELAGAAELVLGKTNGIPAAIIRGLDVRGPGVGHDIVIPEARDLFR